MGLKRWATCWRCNPGQRCRTYLFQHPWLDQWLERLREGVFRPALVRSRRRLDVSRIHREGLVPVWTLSRSFRRWWCVRLWCQPEVSRTQLLCLRRWRWLPAAGIAVQEERRLLRGRCWRFPYLRRHGLRYGVHFSLMLRRGAEPLCSQRGVAFFAQQ